MKSPQISTTPAMLMITVGAFRENDTFGLFNT